MPDACNGVRNGTNFTQACNFNLGALTTRDQEAGRIDIQFNDKNALNLIIKRNVESNPRTDLAFGFETVPYVFQGAGTNFYAVAYNMSPSPSFSNEIRGGYQRSEPFFNEGGVPTDFVFSVNQGQTQTTLANIITNPEGSFRDQGRNTDYWNFEDNANYTRGNHSFRFAVRFNNLQDRCSEFCWCNPITSLLTPRRQPERATLTAALFPGINATDLAAPITCATSWPASSLGPRLRRTWLILPRASVRVLRHDAICAMRTTRSMARISGEFHLI